MQLYFFQFTVTVEENKMDALILRIPVEDRDLARTPNWNAIFSITKGNENENFRIETDAETNNGLLYISKVRLYNIQCTTYINEDSSGTDLFIYTLQVSSLELCSFTFGGGGGSLNNGGFCSSEPNQVNGFNQVY